VLNVPINDRTKQEAKRSPFYLQLAQLIPTLIVRLIAYTTHQSMWIRACRTHNCSETDDEVRHAVWWAVGVLLGTKCARLLREYQLMSDWKTSMLVDVVFPFLATSEREQQIKHEEPEEFVNLALDDCLSMVSEV
jgi:hypothetical protein